MAQLTNLIAAALGVLAISLSTAEAGVHTPPPLTALRLCTAFPAQVIMTTVGSRKLPRASYIPSSTTTASGYATCFYDFSTTKYVSIGLYGPAKVYPTTVGTRVPELSATGRVVNSPPEIIVYAISHGYQMTVAESRAAVTKSALIKLAVYVSQRLP